jgi:hypothetical protein
MSSVALAGASPLRAEITIDVKDGRVDVLAFGAPVADALEQLGEKTAVRIAFSQRPTASLTVELRGLEPRRAIEEILRHLDRGFGYALGLSPDHTQVVAVIVTAPGRVVAAAPDPFEPPAGRGEALERVLEPWQLEAQRAAAMFATTRETPARSSAPAAPATTDPKEPTFGYGADPFSPPEGRGDRPEPVLKPHER